MTDSEKRVAGSNADPPALTEESEPAKKEELEAEAEALAVPAEKFIRNLRVLPPRQKHSDHVSDSNSVCEGDFVPLPPLRAEEPVASIRAALSEVVGYAQLTRYRLVVERQPFVIKPGSVSGDKKSNDGARDLNGSSNKTGGSHSNTANNGSSGGLKKDLDVESVVSPYTLKNALITVPPSVRSLEKSSNAVSCKDTVLGSTSHGEGDEETGATEIVLDDYGDLSTLLPESENEELSDDAPSIAFRVVLERYDSASVRDHLVRTRQLLEGNAPHVISLMTEGEEELAALQVSDVHPKKEPGDAEVTESKKDETIKKAVSEEEQAKARKATAKSLPSFPSDYDLSFDKCTSGGDLTDFYYLACGEEETLARVKEETKKMLNESNGTKNILNDSWMDSVDHHVSSKNANNRNSKKKSPNGSGANGRTKSGKENGKHASSQNKANTGNCLSVNLDSDNPPSLIETERLLNTLNQTAYVQSTVCLSGYHPPPSHRRILGDLAYIQAAMPGGSVFHVTAFSLGFYINRSTSTTFDPTPARDSCYSHSLLDCLLQRSKPLRQAWANALVASKQRADLLRVTSMAENSFASLFRPAVSGFGGHGVGILSVPRVDSVILRPPWLVSLPSRIGGEVAGPKKQLWHHGDMHEYNLSRTEEELTSTFGMDIRGGGLRDWNEELQSAREMPTTMLGERIDRARMVHKVMSDFGDAALVGVKAIYDGYITPMNPNEPTRSHVYLHNNIFFSRAVDAGLDTFKICQGDGAARKSASRDAQNMGVLHRLDIPGLHTLATVLVDYLGTRFVCQSIVPGILYGEKSHTLVYGAVEALSELQCDDDMHKLLESSIGEGCMVATRKILSRPLSEERMEAIKKYRITPLLGGEDNTNEESKDDKSEMISVCGPVEMKGILGSDNRKYVLDCTRLTPRDANWVSKENGGTGRWETVSSETKSDTSIPSSLDDDEWIMCVLRPELVTTFAEKKINEYFRDKVSKAGNDGEKQEPSKDGGDETTSERPDGSEESSKGKSQDEMETSTTKPEVQGSMGVGSKVEDEYIRSLRYNVNVFLPDMKSLESIDKDSYEQLMKDEEVARELAQHLWDHVLPTLTKEIRQSSGSPGQQIPADGKCLTEFIHQRGINCRYLGRLAELAKKEEENDNAAEKAVESKSAAKLPRQRMPLCWLELLECEMVARAAKHVLDAYMTEQGGASATQPAQTVASFLSAVISVSEESAAETELRFEKNRKINNKDVLDEDETNELTLFGAGGNGDAVAAPVRGRAAVWTDIQNEVGRRFRYTLTLYNSELKSKEAPRGRALFVPLLRRICQRSGIRLVGKQYDVGGKCLCAGSNSRDGQLTTSYPISPVDILDILPLVKHAAAVAGDSFVPCTFSGNTGSPSLHVLLSDAKAMYEAGHTHMNNGNLPLALDYAQEAAAMYQRVVETPLHIQILRCLKLTSAAHYHRQETDLAIAAATRSLAVSVSLGGFDCMETLTAHMNMSNILIGAGKAQEGIKHLRAMQFLMELMAGPNYSEISTTYYKVGAQYHEVGRVDDALRYYRMASKKRNDDRMVDCIIARSSAVALARLGQFKPAYDCEKTAYQLYTAFLGEEHEATKGSLNTLMQFMQLAVEQSKVKVVQEQKRCEENAADEVANQIKADEDADEAKKKKKKKNNKKKKKKPASASE